MKKFLPKTFLFLFTLLAFTACKDDDTEEEGTQDDPKALNLLNLGVSAEDILSDDIYKSMTVEFAYSDVYRPSPATLANLRTVLEERVNKPQGINFVETVVAEQPNGPFTTDEIREIEDRIRTQYTEGDNLAVYVFFSNESSENDTNTSVTLGTAYRNTSIVIYQRTLLVVTEENPDILQRIESTTLHHEFGHILGLTNILNDDIHQQHEDLNNGKHCFVDDCLMFFEVNNLNRNQLSSMITRGGDIAQFDPLCIGDLQAKGGK